MVGLKKVSVSGFYVGCCFGGHWFLSHCRIVIFVFPRLGIEMCELGYITYMGLFLKWMGE